MTNDVKKEDPKSPAPGDNALHPGGRHGAPVDVGMSELVRDQVPIKDDDLALPAYDGEPSKEDRNVRTESDPRRK